MIAHTRKNSSCPLSQSRTAILLILPEECSQWTWKIAAAAACQCSDLQDFF